MPSSRNQTRARRRQAGLSLTEAAARARVKPATLRRWLRLKTIGDQTEED